MKTHPVVMRALEAKVSTLPGEADMTVPAEIIKNLLADARQAELLAADSTDPGPTAVLHVDTDEETHVS